MMASVYRSDFFQAGEYRLFVSEHVPKSPRGRVILCAPFLEEKQFCRRYFRHLAQLLAQMDWHVIRFDSVGEGDSEGELQDASIEDALRCIESIAATTEKQDGLPLVLIGLRWGGTLALLSGSVNADAVIAIEPLRRGEEYLQQLLRQNLVTQMATWGAVRQSREVLLKEAAQGKSINIQGYELGSCLIEQMRQVDLPESAPAPRVAVIKLGALDEPPIAAWHQHLDRWGASYTPVDGLPFWYEPKHHDVQKIALTQSVQLQLSEWFS